MEWNDARENKKYYWQMLSAAAKSFRINLDRPVRNIPEDKNEHHSVRIPRERNKNGPGFKNKYVPKTIRGELVVIDHASSLMWQQSGSPDSQCGDVWLRELNKAKHAGFDDWRVPTLNS